MKITADHIRKLAPEDVGALAEILGLDKKGDATVRIPRLLTTPSGLFAVLSTLHENEYRVFVETFRDEKGVTFGQLESALKIDTARIEEISAALSRKLLVYVLKNRQRLHNKTDRITVFQDIRDSFRPLGAPRITTVFREAINSLSRKDETAVPPLPGGAKKPKERALLERALESGGAIDMGELLETASPTSLGDIMGRLLGAGAVEIINEPSWPPCAVMSLTPETFLSLMREKRLGKPEHLETSHNRHGFIMNMLAVFDSVSTQGLFLTKQRNFRKIDIERIARGLTTLRDAAGGEIPPHESLQCTLRVMYGMGLLKLKGDSVIATLKPLQNEIDHPDKILLKIIYQMQNAQDDNPLFSGPQAVPPLHLITFTLELLARLETASTDFLRSASRAKFLAEAGDDHCGRILERIGEFRESFENTAAFLHLAGITRSARGIISLSDIGHAVAAKLVKFSGDTWKKEGKETKTVYINPDFTMLIPREDLASEDLYRIMTRTEVLKDDVVINARISRQSVLKAYKRGMTQEPFLDAIVRHSRNALPQNLTFMLEEWARQTVRVSVQNVMLLKANHPAFIDDLCAGKLKHAVAERISPQHAVVRREFLDDIIKLFQGKEAVISLFEETE